MQNYLELRDALAAFFEKHGSVGEEKLSKIQGTTVGVDLVDFLRNREEKVKTEFNIMKNLNANLKAKNDSQKLEFVFVMEGTKMKQNNGLSFETLFQFNSLLEDMQIHKGPVDQYLSNANLKAKAQANLSSFHKLKLNDSFFLYNYLQANSQKVFNIVNKNQHFILKSPFLVESQLLFMEQNGDVDYVLSSPLIFIQQYFLKSSSRIQVIKQINQHKKLFRFYDFEDLSRKLCMDPDILCHVLFGVFLYFMVKNEEETPKLIKALSGDFEESYNLQLQKDIALIEDTVQLIKKEVSLPPKDTLSFLKDIEKLLGVNYSTQKSLYFYFLKNIVLSSGGSKYFPLQKPLSWNYLQPEMEIFEVVVMNGMFMIDNVFMELLNKNLEGSHHYSPMLTYS